jgi:molybdopterin-containing oxidoreductase family iron-sulfur binding subunit
MSDSIDDDIQAQADELLSDVPYDADLATRMAQDARRVADGDLSRDAYEQRYADAVEAEFGVDLTDGGADSENAPGTPPISGRPSRRSMLKATGALAAGAALAGLGGHAGSNALSGTDTAAAQGSSDEGVQRGMVLDTETCIKCLSCVEACKTENHTPEGHFWMEVDRYQRADREYEDLTDCESLQQPCQHCEDAPCIEVCPNNSRFKTENGRTLCDYDTCLGCKYCEIACPYHVNAFVHSDPPEYVDGEFDGQKRDDQGRWTAGTPPEGSCSKCTFCVHREWDEDQRGTTACEDVCPVDAIHFGDLNDPESDPNQYLEDYDEDETFQIRDDVSNPNVIYVGDDPSTVAVKPVPGPTTHEDLGLEERDPTHH